MSKPTSFPTFATDDLFAGGIEAGTATKVAWTSGRKQEGLEPGSHQLTAQNLNEHLNNIGEWIKFFGYRIGRATEVYTDWRWLSADTVQLNGSSPAGQPTNTGISYSTGVWTLGTVTSSDSLDLPLQLPVGAKIISWSVRADKTSASGTITAKLLRRVYSSGTVTVVDSASNAANNPGAIALGTTLGTPYTVLDSEEYYLGVNPGGITGDSVRGYYVVVLLPPVMLGEGWRATLTGGGTASSLLSSTTGGRAARVDLPANTDAVQLNTSSDLFTPPTAVGMVHVLEWEMDATELVGTTALTWRGGFAHDIPNAATLNCILFEKTSASANYIVRTTTSTGPATSTADTGVAAAAAATRFRIMWFGSSADTGGERAEFYINDVLVATRTTNLSTATDGVDAALYWLSTGATTSTFDLSPAKYTGLRRLFVD